MYPENTQLKTITVKFTPAEMQQIDKLWKSTDDLINRSQFIRAAVNHYAGREVCAQK